jgi:ParB family transcriptional regulator, chromosome partitioning protein
MNNIATINDVENPILTDANGTPLDFTILPDGYAFRAPVDIIDAIPFGNIRRSRDPEEFSELCKQISLSNGVTQGVTVRIDPLNPSRLQLIAGYGRVEASNLLGFAFVPVVFKIADDAKSMAMMASENAAREALSISDDILMASKMLTASGGDNKIAAKELGWHLDKFKSRILLNQCSEAVLDALFEKKILIGHAEILSQFTEIKQNGTLIKLLDEGWSVDTLKQRAGIAVRFIKDAIFDTEGCHGCRHNTTDQADLFSHTVGKAKCADLTCYQSKTLDIISDRKNALEKEYGVVLIASESPQATRKTVSESLVGGKQFTEGCNGCTSNVIVIDDSINKTAGTQTVNQCIDSICLSKMIGKAKKESKQPSKKTTELKDTITSDVVSTSTEPSITAKAKAVVQKMPQGVMEAGADALRLVGADLYKEDTHFLDSICLASHIYKTRFHASEACDPYPTLKEKFSRYGDLVKAIYALSSEELVKLKIESALYTMRVLSTDSERDIRKLMVSMLSTHQQGMQSAITAWKPTTETLNRYLKGGIETLCKKSGFADYYDEKHKNGAFLSLSKKSKSDLIAGIISESSFSWDSFAPTHYTDILKNPV